MDRLCYCIKSLFSASFFSAVFQHLRKQYKNFRVAVYCRAYEVREMGKPSYIEPIWNELSAQLKVDKIYLETDRDLIIVDKATLDFAKQFFKSHGVEVAVALPIPSVNAIASKLFYHR
jgi:hypothetical protein